MRSALGGSVRRTATICLVTGFLSGLITMNIFGRGPSSERLESSRHVVLMEQQLEGAVVVGVNSDDDHQGHQGHGHLHRHDHAHDITGKSAEKSIVGKVDQERSIPPHRTSEGSSSTEQHCTYTWTAAAHRHVIGGQHHPELRTVADCQEACVTITNCSGVDFNGERNCYLIITGSSRATDFHHHDEEKHEAEQGCVHYDLMRACGSASDDDSIADAMNKAVRVLCWIMTTPENHMSKAVHIQATWGRRCTKLIFVTEKDDVGALNAVRVDVETGREHLTAKTMSAFQHIYDHHIDDAEWFMKADDDTYVIMENLRYFLSAEEPSEPVFFGHHFKVIVEPQGYVSGGAGYVLSKEALARFGEKHKGLCREDDGAEDVEIGDCMQKLGVRLGDSRDSLGRSRFHCFDPPTHIHGGYPDWYRQYDKYGAKQGIESISDYAISFHYVPVEQLYNLEFYVYHLRPYGVVAGLQELNRGTRVRSTAERTSVLPGSAASHPSSSDNTPGLAEIRAASPALPV